MNHRFVIAAVLVTALTLAACATGTTTTTVEAPVTTSTAALSPSTTATTVATTTTVPEALRSDCATCHGDVQQTELASSHASTQEAVAFELAEERAGETPEDVIHGDDPENCIACHGPTAAATLTDVEALGSFFSTVDGKFSADTEAIDQENWPSISCTACHEAAADHPESSMPALAIFDSPTQSYEPVPNESALCGQCHGTLRFDTDHQTYDAWTMASHANTQEDVAAELAEERAGETPTDVIRGDDPENCIACHGPTAVRANGGMSEEDALAYFFTTTNGEFTAETAIAHPEDWPNVSCEACHNPHNPTIPSLFDSATASYLPMDDGPQLCGQCHGTLRFETDHRSYDVIAGTGGVGVAETHTMPGATCTTCHMYTSAEEATNSSTFHGHTWSIFVSEEGGAVTASCSQCHPDFTTEDMKSKISDWQAEFQALDETVAAEVAAAAEALGDSDDAVLRANLDAAESNLALAEGDESGGFHNHEFTMALLKAAEANAEEVLAALGK